MNKPASSTNDSMLIDGVASAITIHLAQECVKAIFGDCRHVSRFSRDGSLFGRPEIITFDQAVKQLIPILQQAIEKTDIGRSI